MILAEIETMLNDDLPVVISYHTGDENNQLTMYSTLENAKNYIDVDGEPIKSHYVTVIGLYKYLDENATSYDYILEVVSWGKNYYVRYDEYSNNIHFFSNIMRIY